MLDDATQKEIKDHYITGQSIQAIARTYRCSVEEVLHIIGEDDMTKVQLVGDMIDPEDAGNASVNYQGTTHKVPYSTD